MNLAKRKRSAGSLFVALRTTFRYILGRSEGFKEATEEYPDRVSARMPEDLPQRYRGLLVNDIETCTGCGNCVTTCPVNCIRIETEPGPAKNISWVSVFDVDNARCMFCGLCVEVCPPKSLEHTRQYEGAAFRIEDMVKSFGRGYATRDMKDRWVKDQKIMESQAEELALLEQSPVGAELKRRFRSEKRE